jgi:hypothetical protein
LGSAFGSTSAESPTTRKLLKPATKIWMTTARRMVRSVKTPPSSFRAMTQRAFRGSRLP